MECLQARLVFSILMPGCVPDLGWKYLPAIIKFMDELIQFVARNGYIVIFVGVLIEQLGIPLPSNLLLIIAGALVGAGQLDLAFVVSMTVLAALLGDTIWYFIGRSRGFQVLGFLCKISLEPDYCVSNAKSAFMRNGERTLLIAKFVPGLSTFAQPLAGATRMTLSRFLVFDAIGSLLWAVVLSVWGLHLAINSRALPIMLRVLDGG